MLKSHNGIVKACTLNALSNAISPMGSNSSFLRSKYGINFHSHSLAHCIKVATTVEQLDSQSNCLIEQVRILLRIKCHEYVINGFTHAEITELIREIVLLLYICIVIVFIFLKLYYYCNNIIFIYIHVYLFIPFVYDINKINK